MLGGRTAAATVFVDVEGDLTKFKQDLRQAGDATRKEMGALQRNAKIAGGAAVGAAAGIFAASAKTFVDFDKGIREVYTLLPDASQALRDQLAEDVKGISTEYGQELGTVTQSFYDSISAGVDPAQARAFVEEAAKLATAGATDISVATDGLTGVVNAYGAANLSAAQASDILFGTVKAGKTTIDELASKVANVTPIASELGIGFDQVGAAFASVTATTGNTAEASTQLRAILSELSKDGQKAFKNFADATGTSFREFIANGGTLGDALVELEAYAAESGKSLGDMFGSVEAGGAALILAGDGAAKFNDSLGSIQDGAGSTQAAYEEMEESLAVQLDKVKASLSVAALNIGTAIAPALTGLAEGLAGVATFLAELPGPIGAVATGALGLGGALLFLAGPIMRATSLIKGMFALLTANPYVLIIAATIALVIVIVKNWDTIVAAVTTAMQWIWGVIQTVWGGIRDFLGSVLDVIGGYIEMRFIAPVRAIIGFFQDLPGYASTAWNAVVDAVTSAVDRLRDLLGELAGLADRALGPIDEIVGGVAGFAGGLLGFDDGGVVPGPKGAPRLVLAHGGETILPTHKHPIAAPGTAPAAAGGDTYNLSVNVTGGVRSEEDIVAIQRALQREMDRARGMRGRKAIR
jgi:TP901 family phage tail tape measure protein